MTKPSRGDTPTVIYLCPDFSDSLSAALFRDLANYGLRQVGCASVAGLKRILYEPSISNKHPAVIMIDGRQPDSFERTAVVRALYPMVGIVALSKLSDHWVALTHMHAGADIWSPIDTPVALVAAQVLRLVWRLQQPSSRGVKIVSPGSALLNASEQALNPHKPHAEPEARWWRVNEGWMIWTPEGLSIRLTPTERALLQALWQAPDGRATHAALQLAIQQSRQTASKSPGYPALVISRLRRKFLRKGVALPMQSVRSWGYMLTVEFADFSDQGSSASSLYAG